MFSVKVDVKRVHGKGGRFLRHTPLLKTIASRALDKGAAYLTLLKWEIFLGQSWPANRPYTVSKKLAKGIPPLVYRETGDLLKTMGPHRKAWNIIDWGVPKGSEAYKKLAFNEFGTIYSVARPFFSLIATSENIRKVNEIIRNHIRKELGLM